MVPITATPHHITVADLFRQTGDRLRMSWIAGRGGGDRELTSDTVQKPALALIGHLNFVHPNRVQVLGCAEMDYLRHLSGEGLRQAVANLYEAELAAVVVANGEAVPDELVQAAERTSTPLFTTPESSPDLMRILSHMMTQALAPSTVMHGVFLEVTGLGVLITGDPAVGKSELALELITRGHRLVADDAVEVFSVSPDTLEGRCPNMLQDFLATRNAQLRITHSHGALEIRVVRGASDAGAHLELAGGRTNLLNEQWNHGEISIRDIEPPVHGLLRDLGSAAQRQLEWHVPGHRRNQIAAREPHRRGIPATRAAALQAWR